MSAPYRNLLLSSILAAGAGINLSGLASSTWPRRQTYLGGTMDGSIYWLILSALILANIGLVGVLAMLFWETDLRRRLFQSKKKREAFEALLESLEKRD